MRWFAGWIDPPLPQRIVLLFAWPLTATVSLGLGVAVFSVLAIAINVKNRQRSTLFQIASAFALTSSSLATSLSATGTIAPGAGGCGSCSPCRPQRESSSFTPVSTPASPYAPPHPPAKITVAPLKSHFLSWSALRSQPSSSAVASSRSHLWWLPRLRLRSPSPAQRRGPPTPAQVSRPAGAGPVLSLRYPAHHRPLVNAKHREPRALSCPTRPSGLPHPQPRDESRQLEVCRHTHHLIRYPCPHGPADWRQPTRANHRRGLSRCGPPRRRLARLPPRLHAMLPRRIRHQRARCPTPRRRHEDSARRKSKSRRQP